VSEKVKLCSCGFDASGLVSTCPECRVGRVLNPAAVERAAKELRHNPEGDSTRLAVAVLLAACGRTTVDRC
jgi:hypothetical protein